MHLFYKISKATKYFSHLWLDLFYDLLDRHLQFLHPEYMMRTKSRLHFIEGSYIYVYCLVALDYNLEIIWINLFVCTNSML